MEGIKELKELLNDPKRIVIVSHRNPDGDAVGSSLALFHFLKEKHKVEILMPSDYPPFLNWMSEIERIKVFDNDGPECISLIEDSDLIFLLDFNALSRIDKLGEAIALRPKDSVVMIDHHINPDDVAGLVFSETKSSSTCELLYRVMSELKIEQISIESSECLYLGLITDTGGFKYNTTYQTFEVVSALNKNGIDNFRMHDIVFNNSDEKQLHVLGWSLVEKMEVFPDYHTGLIVLNREDFEKFDIQRGDTEGIVNYILKIKGIKFAIFVREQPTGVVKLSFRSRGSFSVHSFAKEHFKGGGHKNASGGFSYLPVRKVVKTIKDLLPQYAEELNNAKIYE